MIDIRAIVHHIRAGESDRRIGRDLKIDRRTVKKYRTWAKAQGLLEGELPEPGALFTLLEQKMPESVPPQNQSSAEAYRSRILALHKNGIEIAAISERLKEEGYAGGYWPVYRLVRRASPIEPDVTVRVECKPGEEAQVDFGYAGRMIDPATGKERKSWAFVMTLSWSRHQYVEFVFDQKVATWLRLHRNAFQFFGGSKHKYRVIIGSGDS